MGAQCGRWFGHISKFRLKGNQCELLKCFPRNGACIECVEAQRELNAVWKEPRVVVVVVGCIQFDGQQVWELLQRG